MIGNTGQGTEERMDIPHSLGEDPLKLFVEITTRCNLKCGMCVKQHDPGACAEGDMSPETFAALEPSFSHLDTLIMNGIGEPLLHPRLEEYIRRAKERMSSHAWVGFQSNGMLLTEERALSLLEAGLDRICLSMDALSQSGFRRIRPGGEVKDVQRGFEALSRAKKTSRENALKIGIEVVVMRDNISELPGTLRWAARHGATFAIVTHLLPYDRSLASQAVYDTNTRGAIGVYRDWKRRAEHEGLNLARYFDTFMKYWKDHDEEKLFSLVEEMKNHALSQGIALHVERLLKRDEKWFDRVEQVFDEVLRVGQEENIAITLPEIAPRNTRKCEFVEANSTFVSWDGNVHPCYFLWHRYGCYVGGWEKQVEPWVFGNLSERNIIDIWSAPDFRVFREGVLRYDFPFCFDCSFALCDLAQLGHFVQDCYTNRVPCGACLWCTGLFHCLQ